MDITVSINWIILKTINQYLQVHSIRKTIYYWLGAWLQLVLEQTVRCSWTVWFFVMFDMFKVWFWAKMWCSEVFEVRSCCTLGHRVHKNGILANFRYAFLNIIDVFRTPRWKENHSEELKKVYRKSTNESWTWTKIQITSYHLIQKIGTNQKFGTLKFNPWFIYLKVHML